MRLRRRGPADATDEPTAEETEAAQAAAAQPERPRDTDEVDPDPEDHVDLGSLLIRPFDGSELRLQVDEESGEVLAVLLVGEEGALEVRAFAAPRHGDLWAETRTEIAADTVRRGGTAEEVEGRFGPELRCEMPVPTTEGRMAMQPSRVIGVNGPRWFLRASLMGRPAVEAEVAGPWEQALLDLVVHRGGEAMPEGEPLPLHLPPQARRTS